MKKLMFFYLLSIFLAVSASAQDVLLEKDVAGDTITDETGPNLKKFTHIYSGYGFILGPSEGSGVKTIPGVSTNFISGIRHKRKISNFYAVGGSISYQLNTFRIDQNKDKIFPNRILHNKEKLTYNNLELEVYNRFNFGKRGNILGTYVDIGGYGNWGFSVKHIYKDNHDIANNAGARTSQVKNTGLIFINPINYGGIVRLGYNKVALYAKYRASDLFWEQYDYPELPRFIGGVEFAVYF